MVDDSVLEDNRLIAYFSFLFYNLEVVKYYHSYKQVIFFPLKIWENTDF